MFALGPRPPEGFFADKIDRHISLFRVPQLPGTGEGPARGQIRAGAHSDYGSLTIRDTEDGLVACRCATAAGEWVDVPVVADCARW